MLVLIGFGSIALGARASGAPVLRAGPARTDEEILLCRDEESARARGRAGPPIEPPSQPVTLRSVPAQLDPKACDQAARKWNFWTRNNQARGCFVNMHSTSLDTPLVVDLATGLMWSKGAGPQKSFPQALEHVRKVNARKWQGHADWRLPTTEELQSHRESAPFAGAPPRHTDPDVMAQATAWWSADPSSVKGEQLAVSDDGECESLDPQVSEWSVQVVRTMSAAEWEKARAEYRPPKR